ncbi:MATE family efflux transporter [Anaerocolumna chitinilytica]|uniref:Probable multidrug resistance protein NorM n=1 Tax=Anaerocolumna chitinilytica TaxID=1727145 RepID=A0A7I8DLJ1_9FIRM|nr:MATE family efflux transporter [Anaerocolumna chitinilytica]BCJ98174.1 MATE family efflux transporter [Anaerocolumna chitinilytica]
MYKYNNLSTGNVAKQLLSFAFPFIITNIIQTLYGVIDMIIVGQFCGTDSMSGVNIGGQVTNLVMNIAIGLCAGTTILIAQSVGAGRLNQLKRIIGTLFTVLGIVSVIMTGLILLLSNSILELINTPAESFQEAKNFLIVTALGIVFIFGYNALSAIMRGMGDSKNPLYFVTIACIVNVILDFILVGGLGLGALGAGIATVISQGISMLLCVIYLMKKKFVFDFKLRSFLIDSIQLKAILKIGIPMSVQNLITNLSFIFMTALVNTIGVTASAAVGAVGKYNGFAILPAIAMSAAISTMCAQNFGAGEVERAKKTWLYGMGIACVISYIIFILTIIFPGEILSIFSNDENLIRIGTPYLQAFSLDYLFVPITFTMNGLFNGAGHTRFTLINNMLSGIVVRIPMAYLLYTLLDNGLFGVGLAAPAASLNAVIISLCFFLSGRWKRKIIRFEEKVETDYLKEEAEMV